VCLISKKTSSNLQANRLGFSSSKESHANFPAQNHHLKNIVKRSGLMQNGKTIEIYSSV
jgi:hypothetical protein